MGIIFMSGRGLLIIFFIISLAQAIPDPYYVNYPALKDGACERLSETKQLTRGHNKSCRSVVGYKDVRVLP